MNAIRDVYLEATSSMSALLRHPAVAAAWDQPSALTGYSIHGLAGHLGSQVFHVSRLLEGEAPDEDPLSVPEFFAGARAFHAEVDAEISVRIRQGGEAASAEGPTALADEVELAITHQRTALRTEPADRVVAMAGRPLRLDDFLLTRMMEIVVHTDDLAVSVDIATPSFPPQVFEPVLELLSRLAVVRHGQPAILRALTRAERAPATITAF